MKRKRESRGKQRRALRMAKRYGESGQRVMITLAKEYDCDVFLPRMNWWSLAALVIYLANQLAMERGSHPRHVYRCARDKLRPLHLHIKDKPSKWRDKIAAMDQGGEIVPNTERDSG